MEILGAPVLKDFPVVKHTLPSEPSSEPDHTAPVWIGKGAAGGPK